MPHLNAFFEYGKGFGSFGTDEHLNYLLVSPMKVNWGTWLVGSRQLTLKLFIWIFQTNIERIVLASSQIGFVCDNLQ